MADELAAAIHRAATLEGSFTLRSGLTAATYFDKFQLTGDPVLLTAIVERLVPLVPADTEVLAGLELGGVPVAAALSLRTGLPTTYVRKQRKGYGTQRIAEGPSVADRRVTIVEDVATTGGQMLLSAEDLRAEGATVTTALVMIDREQGAVAALAEAGIDLRAAFTRSDLEAAAD